MSTSCNLHPSLPSHRIAAWLSRPLPPSLPLSFSFKFASVQHSFDSLYHSFPSFCRMRHEEPRNLVGGQYFHWLDEDLSEQRGLCWKIFLRFQRVRDGGDGEEGQRRAKKGEEARSSRRELGLCHRKRLGKFSVVHWSYWQKAKLEEIVHIMAWGRRSMKVQERFRKERFSLGSHGLYGWIRNAEHFLVRKMWPHPPIQMNRRRIRSRGEAETARGNDSDVRFASRFIDALFRKWRAICRVPFGPRRHVISRMASASYSIRMFPLFRCHSARVSSLTHGFSDCTSLRRDSMRWIASAERAAVATCIMSRNLCSFSGSSNRTRYPLIFIETKVQKNSPLQRTDDESAMKFHYREMFVKRFRPSKVLFSA